MTNKEQENKKILKGEEQGNIESPPDPKTVSNATRVDEWVDANGVRHTANEKAKLKKNTNQSGSDIDEDVDELPPSSDQPEELAAKEAKQESQKDAGAGPQENKNKDNKKDSNKSNQTKASNDKIETKTTTTTVAKNKKD